MKTRKASMSFKRSGVFSSYDIQSASIGLCVVEALLVFGPAISAVRRVIT